jgi:hypothetical protein
MRRVALMGWSSGITRGVWEPFGVSDWAAGTTGLLSDQVSDNKITSCHPVEGFGHACA